MKLDYNWLKDYIKCDLSVNQIAEIMTSVGIEVDGVEETEVIEGGLKNVVVAKVLTCDIHPDSDHLHITTVDDGSGTPLQVVCGAPNVAAGQKVLFAKVGAVLPGDFKIKKSKIRGVESLGMICAEDELGIGEIRIVNKTMKIGCRDGAIEALEVQLEGKRRMDTASFLAGYKIQNGTNVQ